jgi:hypothetical protein
VYWSSRVGPASSNSGPGKRNQRSFNACERIHM